MTDPARLWTRCWNAFSKHLARALSPTVAWSLSASRAIVRPGLLVALLIVVAPVCLVLTQSGLHASGNTITVNNLTDPASTSGNGFCTLREAINNANSPGTDTTGGDCVVGTGTDTINFSVSGTITLAQGELPTLNTLTIDGTSQTITVDGANAYTVLAVNSGATLTVNDLTIAHGNASSLGGGIDNEGGTLTVTNSTFSSNSAPNGDGGGIYSGICSGVVLMCSGGTLTVTNSTFSSNSALDGNASTSEGYGGGIAIVGGTLTVSNSTFTMNTGTGGGIYSSVNATVTNSTFSGNIANAAPNGASAGGIANDNIRGAGKMTVTNSTFSGNSAGISGGGITNVNSATLTVTNSTFSGNSAASGDGGAIYNQTGSTVTVTNSILAGSGVGGNCSVNSSTVVTNGGDNISDDSTCGLGAARPPTAIRSAITSVSLLMWGSAGWGLTAGRPRPLCL
jgi:predicted outer membrane repeat protein